MITRSFLFLLAMITGFSPAQAAENVRQTPEMVRSASSVAHATAVLWAADPAATEANGIDLSQKITLHQAALRPIFIAFSPPITATIFVGDRDRQ